MRRMLAAAVIGITLMFPGVAPVHASGPHSVNGGGHGTLDGQTAFSQFGLQVSLDADGKVNGHFNCLMAGVSEFPGFDLMAVRGQVTEAEFEGDTASFSGSGMFQTGNQGKAPATFRVVVTQGGPGVGTLRLTLVTPFEFALPTEYVLNGAIHLD